MVSYDVVIIGAGPAGLNCAEKLAGANIQTIVLEKSDRVGPKVCAGGITRYNMEYLKLPDKIIGGKFNEIKMHTPYHTVRIQHDEPLLYTVDRRSLGKWQLDRLKKTDVELRTDTRVTGIHKDHVVVNGSDKIGFRYLVGADGSKSIVRKHLGIRTNGLCYGFHYMIPTRKYKDLEIFLDSKLLKTWYAWIFPHRDFVSIGTGCNPKILPINDAKKNFHKLLEKNDIDITGGRFQMAPINHLYKGFHFGNVYLIGDAAGLASSLTGEGVYQAMISGEEIAKMILDNDHVPSALNKIIHSLQFHDYCRLFMEQIGPFRLIGYEIMVLFIRKMVGLKPFLKFYP